MPTMCPNCGHENPDQSTFCVKCGNRFQMTGQPGQTGPFSGSNAFPTYVSTMPASMSAPLSAPLSPPPPPPAIYAQPSPGWGAMNNPPAPVQMGTGQGLASIRRAFAGHGTLIMHHSWLLDGKQVQAISALTTIKDLLAQRKYAAMNVTPERLMERGVLMEARDYLTVNRNGSTVFVYVAPAGDDLYISRATTVLAPISILRVILFGLLLFTVFFGPFIVSANVQNTMTNATTASVGSSSNAILAAAFTSLLIAAVFFFLYPFFLSALVYFLYRAITSWLLDKDFWVLLRPNVLNDFQMDDIALLEHSTDRVVRDAVAHLGLDASKIVPPAQGYQPKRKTRVI